MAEVTPLNCEGQFKPFVYLNWRTGLPAFAGRRGNAASTAQRKIPPFGGTFLLSLGVPSN
jgi:hypothetical protein